MTPSPPPADPNRQVPYEGPHEGPRDAPCNFPHEVSHDAPTRYTSDDGKAFDYFGDRVSWLDRLRMQASLRVRRQMYEWMRDRLGGMAGKTILDHGSTPDTEHIDSNCFIEWAIADGATVYATSPEPIDHLEQVFPGLCVLTFPPAPGTTPRLDCVLSSATIEHVGSEASQIQYCRDLLALAPRLCLTTPNRYHWLDFHTKIPLIHWLPRRWHRGILRAIGLKFWSFEANLRLLSKADLDRILRRSTSSNSNIPEPSEPLTVEWCEPKFLGCVSNLAVCVQRE
ncbi:MAG: hypothetical protein ACFB9N_12010 [Geitlerinemataceae cyanobacterium]